MIYFALVSYSPNTAETNRLRGYWDSFEKNGVDICVVFLQQYDMKYQVSNHYNHVHFRYFYGFSSSKLLSIVAFGYHIIKLFFTIHKGDTVYTYGINKTTKLLLNKRGIRVVSEQTEHPSIPNGGRIINLSSVKKIKVAKCLDYVVVISNSLKKLFVDEGVDTDKIVVVNMTVDINRFNGVCKQNKPRYIAYCGSVSNSKDGVDNLIRAFSIVQRAVDDVFLYIIGKAENEQVKYNIIELVKQLGIEKKVVFTGQIPAQKMPQILKDAEILALFRPNNIQARYGFPTKLGEYLLTENPVILTNVGDIAFFLKDGESALIAEASNVEMFADKLLWALNNPDEASKIGRRGKEVALKYFNSEIETQKLIKILRS